MQGSLQRDWCGLAGDDVRAARGLGADQQREASGLPGQGVQDGPTQRRADDVQQPPEVLGVGQPTCGTEVGVVGCSSGRGRRLRSTRPCHVRRNRALQVVLDVAEGIRVPFC